MKKIWDRIKEVWKDEQGITTVEVILLMVVLIAVVLLFKEQILGLVEDIMDKISQQAMRV